MEDLISSSMNTLEITQEVLNGWVSAIHNLQFRVAGEVAINGINKLQSLTVAASDKENIYKRCGLVILNGLVDLAELQLIRREENWRDYPEAVNTAWCLAHEGAYRIEGCRLELNPEFRAYVTDIVLECMSEINERYGTGLFISGGIIHKSALCSICGEDLRGCDHELGQFYGSKVCHLVPQVSHIDHVAVVEVARDPRCRIWPWNCENGDDGCIKFKDVPVMISFSLEGDPSVPRSLLDVAKLFKKK